MNLKKYLDTIPSLEGKTIIVTGANSGVGFELCRHLLSKNAKVVMACRNQKKAEVAIDLLRKDFETGEIEFLEFDQGSFESIDKAVEVIKKKYQDFYGLVCNAGTLGPRKGGEFTKEGFPLAVGTNYLGLFYFYKKMQQFLDESTMKRKIIFQGSLVAGFKTSKKLDLLTDDASQWKKYNLSKKCVETLFKYAYSNNNNENIDYLLSEPGVSKTSLFNSMNSLFRTVGGLFIKLTCHSPKIASLTMLRCLSEDTKNGETYLPRGPLRVRGYPKRFKYKENRYVERFITRGEECLCQK